MTGLLGMILGGAASLYKANESRKSSKKIQTYKDMYGEKDWFRHYATDSKPIGERVQIKLSCGYPLTDEEKEYWNRKTQLKCPYCGEWNIKRNIPYCDKCRRTFSN